MRVAARLLSRCLVLELEALRDSIANFTDVRLMCDVLELSNVYTPRHTAKNAPAPHANCTGFARTGCDLYARYTRLLGAAQCVQRKFL